MSPVRAQGINMALRDAIVAANHLVPAAKAGGDLDAAAIEVARERTPEIRRIQTLQIREVRGQRWARERPWLMKPLLAIAPALTSRA
jgi:2-polyprenyl-6-methoxyphenol hydroxylase-like FAD-dependent oxidoreductase